MKQNIVTYQKQPPEVFCKNVLPQPAILLKKRLWHRCFPMNFAKFLRTAFLQNTSERLLRNYATLQCTLNHQPVSLFSTFSQPSVSLYPSWLTPYPVILKFIMKNWISMGIGDIILESLSFYMMRTLVVKWSTITPLHGFFK